MMHLGTVTTPDGDFSVIVCGAAVIASGWTTDHVDLLSRVHPSLAGSSLGADADATRQALDAVQAYYDGHIDAIDGVEVAQAATSFRARVWRALRDVAPGSPISYAELASRSGNPSAIRAAASACAANPAALFVPCHRVVAKNGGLAGFLYGLELKRRLLHREAEAHPQES